MRRWRRAVLVTGIFMSACLFSPALANALAQAVSIPALRVLAGWTGAVAYPVIGLLLALLIALACLIRPRILSTTLALVILFNFLWYPLCLSDPQTAPPATSDAVFALCSELVSDLNANGRQTISVQDALARSKDVMHAPASAKAVRYPEWMRKLHIAGIFVPFTGEALVDTTRSAVATPFTAAHELAHMMGIADEAAANYAAYVACTDYGGAFAYSARLWALRYALARVENPGEVIRALDAGIQSDLSSIPSVTGVDGDYGNVVDMLAANPS